MQPHNPYAPPPPPLAPHTPVIPQPHYGQPQSPTAFPPQTTGIASPPPFVQSSENPSGNMKMIIVATIAGIIVLSGGGFSGYFLGKSAGVKEATGGTPDEDYAGKWFKQNCYTYYNGDETNCNYDAIWLKDDGSILQWSTPYFECSDGMHIRGSNVNDGDNDCLDGTDEGTTKADNFNSDLVWFDSNGIKIANYNANSASDYYNLEMNWGINDADEFCFSYQIHKGDDFHAGITTCQEIWLSNGAIWHQYELLDDDARHVGNDESDCDLMVRIDRASGPPVDDNQAWSDLMNLEISDAMAGKPSACSGTTYQELTEGFADDYDY